MEIKYEWQNQYMKKRNEKNIKDFNSSFGSKIISRNKDGTAKIVEFSLYTQNKNQEVYLIGDFNNWQEDLLALKKYKLVYDEKTGFVKIQIDNIKHKSKYKFIVITNLEINYYQDPASVYFDDLGNSIFWDFKDKTSYQEKYKSPLKIEMSTKIIQTDLPGLISHWANEEGICGRDIDKKDYYKFIYESKIIKHLKYLGFNTIQFLPFAQSIDGNNWKFRYLVPFQFSIQKNWGNPDEFKRMIDEFHKEGISVIGDFVIGHLPFKNYEIFGQNCEKNGLHVWRKEDNNYTYLKEETNWGTIRPDFDNYKIRNFFIESCLMFLKNYSIDGFRIDNVDGIIRYGVNGQGEERENGRTFLRELTTIIYKYNKNALINFESHYYWEDNAKLLVNPIKENIKSLGSTTYNDSRLTYYFHTIYMLKKAKETSVWKFKYLIEEKQWGHSASTIADFHNHDAAAGLMKQRATGSYAYDTMTCKNPENHFHAIGKIKVMEAIISFIQDGRTLDLIQTFLIQTGTFEHESSIHWDLTFNQASKNLLNFKREINLILDNPAFWPLFEENREFLNLDEKNKIIQIERRAKIDNQEYRFNIIINISSYKLNNYKIACKTKNPYEIILNSDFFEYCGTGLSNPSKILYPKKSSQFELIEYEINLPDISAYHVLVLKELIPK